MAAMPKNNATDPWQLTVPPPLAANRSSRSGQAVKTPLQHFAHRSWQTERLVGTKSLNSR
jgi:hypothetical protein